MLGGVGGCTVWSCALSKKKRVVGIKRDDGTILKFDKPVKLGQALSAKAREKR